jgi:hypothetical protein
MNILALLMIGVLEMSSGILIAIFLNGDTSAFWRGALAPIVAIWLVIIGPLCVFGALSLTIALLFSLLMTTKKVVFR